MYASFAKFPDEGSADTVATDPLKFIDVPCGPVGP
jgi:hypothetical protein